MRRALAVAALVTALAACNQDGSAGLDPDLKAGRDTYIGVCAACHGGNGQGASAPALASVVETFSACSDHIQWITLGSERHKNEVGPTYGDQGKEITGVMPEFGASLGDREIARVAAYERHQFGGAGAEDVRADCGL